MINKLSILKFLLFISAIICQYTYANQKTKVETDSIQIYVEKNNVIKAIEFARKKSLIYLKNTRWPWTFQWNLRPGWDTGTCRR